MTFPKSCQNLYEKGRECRVCVCLCVLEQRSNVFGSTINHFGFLSLFGGVVEDVDGWQSGMTGGAHAELG